MDAFHVTSVMCLCSICRICVLLSISFGQKWLSSERVAIFRATIHNSYPRNRYIHKRYLFYQPILDATTVTSDEKTIATYLGAHICNSYSRKRY